MSTNSRIRTFGTREAGPGRPVYITGEIASTTTATSRTPSS